MLHIFGGSGALALTRGIIKEPQRPQATGIESSLTADLTEET